MKITSILKIHIPKLRIILLPLLLLALMMPSILWSQENSQNKESSLTASLDSTSAKIGRIITLTLSFSLPEGANLDSPPKIQGLEGLTIIEKSIDQNFINIRLLIDKLGKWETGPLSLSYQDKDGNAEIISCEPVVVTVLSNLGDKPEEAQLRPIQDILPSKPMWFRYLPWIGGLLVLLVIGLGIFWWLKKRKQGKYSTTPVEPPHWLARKNIEKLEAEKLFEKGEIKLFYFRFSEILRQYLESLRGFPAAEYTTEEIISRLEKEQDRVLIPLLRQADLAKFANYVPTTAGKEEEVKISLSYVARTGVVFEDETQKDRSGVGK